MGFRHTKGIHVTQEPKKEAPILEGPLLLPEIETQDSGQPELPKQKESNVVSKKKTTTKKKKSTKKKKKVVAKK